MDPVLTKGILCVIDLAEPSTEALRWSVLLAESLNTKLTILYAYRLYSTCLPGDATELKRKIEVDANQQFSELEKELLLGRKISYEFKAEVGFISNRVKEFSRKHGLSFLVAGDKIRTSNRESFDELMKETRVPLVIIPDDPG